MGDCWLMSAVASLAEFPTSLVKLFHERELSADGKYHIQLYAPATNTREWGSAGWRTIVIDDLVPCLRKEYETEGVQ